MTGGTVSKRYARALIEAVAGEAAGRDLEATERDLQVFVGLLRDHRDLRDFFANPGVQRHDKESALDRLTDGLGLAPTVRAFLRLLAQKGRLGNTEIIARTYRHLMDERLGQVRAEVTSAVPLDASAQSALADRLARVTNRRVVLETKTDPGLLGGLMARIGDTVYDGSLRAQLGRLREELQRG